VGLLDGPDKEHHHWRKEFAQPGTRGGQCRLLDSGWSVGEGSVAGGKSMLWVTKARREVAVNTSQVPVAADSVINNRDNENEGFSETSSDPERFGEFSRGPLGQD